MDREREAGWRPATRLVRGGTHRSAHGETSEALYLTSGYVYDDAEAAEARFKGADGFIYSRYGNPTVAAFERRLALLEGAESCFTTASGMAAVFAALACQLKAGDHIVASRVMFGSCHVVITEILPRFGMRATLVDGRDPDAWRAALAAGARAVFLESPANPTTELVDIAAVAALAHGAGARLVVDNVFSTALWQRPLALGADVVVYSATKHIDGQGRCLGGAVLASEAFVKNELVPFCRHTGPSLSPFNAWVMLKGLETLPLRLARHGESATTVARHLERHGAVGRVLYPGLNSHPQHALARRQMSGFGSIVAFDLPDGKAAAFRFLDTLRLIDISNNLGDAKSMITHPATTTHQRLKPEERAALGIGDGLVRLSVGLEDVDDLIEDLDQALDHLTRV
ncbi:MAG: O-succinylhomoserine sulfhydrylase [Alphaproteobacteria bacterium]|nr:O-succinylhomoserine sulfhydrylase [Alphaproteobacteria bacterium]